jgi:hypothetical protein
VLVPVGTDEADFVAVDDDLAAAVDADVDALFWKWCWNEF